MINDYYYIFGAKATAVGLYKALSALESERRIKAFLVSNTEENTSEIWTVPVRSLSDEAKFLSEEDRADILIYAAVPELVHMEIKTLLMSYGFRNIVMLDSHLEADLMGRYFEVVGEFKSVHSLGYDKNTRIPKITIYAASFFKDKPLSNPPKMPSYIKNLYLGCDGAKKSGVNISSRADYYDNTGDNISVLNPNRCEMTAHYWVWKNMLGDSVSDDEYAGICHYRRTLDLSDDDLKRMRQNAVDVVLPFPMIHYPNAGIQHTWYVPEKDWITMRRVLKDLQPAYEERFDEIFDQPCFYNYNMLIAKKKVFADYCAWLYPILDRIEEVSEPKGKDRHDRYTAYMSESLETLYFMANLNELKIYHTGRLLYT